jgi:hypothetical protein
MWKQAFIALFETLDGHLPAEENHESLSQDTRCNGIFRTDHFQFEIYGTISAGNVKLSLRLTN